MGSQMRRPDRHGAMRALSRPHQFPMRRISRLLPAAALLPLLAGCAGVGSYMHDSLDPFGTPNAPQNQSVNMRRALGESVAVKPITPQEGDVWPGPVKPVPTLSQIQKDMNIPLSQEYQQQYGSPASGGTTYTVPSNAVPQSVQGKGSTVHQRNGSGTAALYGRAVKGSATPAGSAGAGSMPAPKPGTAPSITAPGITTEKGFAVGTTVIGQGGPVGIVTSKGNGRYQTVAPINGKGGGILIPNGSGTATLIGPNGAVETVHAPRH